MFRKLRADEIEVRIGTIMKDGVSLLLYKDARCDMNILDETVGTMNWQKHYDLIDGQLFCTLQIWDDDKKQWISKQDVGVESNTEAEKGRASDAQKRAAVAAGIGRELYTAPRIKIKCATKPKNNGYGYELVNKWEFYGVYVSSIGYDENGNINSLELKKDKAIIYQFGFGNKGIAEPMQQNDSPDMSSQITPVEAKSLKEWAARLGVSEEKICKQYNVADISCMSKEEYGRCCRKLIATEEKKKGKVIGNEAE